MHVHTVLEEAAEWEWCLNHPLADRTGPTEDLAAVRAGLRGAEAGDREARALDKRLELLGVKLARLHGGLRAVAIAQGVRLYEITGTEELCGPSALSAITGRPTEECAEAMAQNARSAAAALRSEAVFLNVRSRQGPRRPLKRLLADRAAQVSRMADSLETQARRRRAIIGPAAAALGVEMVSTYEKDSGDQCAVHSFVKSLSEGVYLIGAWNQGGGHAIAVDRVGDDLAWFADNSSRRPVPFFPSVNPFRQVDPGETVYFCFEADLPKRTLGDPLGLDGAVDGLVTILSGLA